MSPEENIKQQLAKKFGYLENKINITRPRRLFLEVDLANFREVFDYIVKALNFAHLISITGLDEAENLGFIYHLGAENGIVLNLKTSANKNNPAIKTVTNYFPGADIYERELIDLFGAKVEGMAPGDRYPLTDDWPKGEFPLRKDWKPSL